MKVNTSELKKGDLFLHKGCMWIVTSNDGFIFNADCLDKESPMHNLIFFGTSEEVERV